jgi:hypothetical protein
MAKKKKNQSKAAATKPAPPPPSATSPTPAKPAQPSATGNNKPLMLVAAIVVPLVLLGAVAIWLLSRPNPAATTSPAAPVAAVFTGTVGSVDGCRIQPPFTQRLGFGRSTLLSTAERTVKGLILIEPAPAGQAPRTYQHPSWTVGGYLGPNAFDAKGNLYVAPSPRVSLSDNPPEKQNTIYKVDGETGEMTAFITLPPAAPITLRNPYGVMGLTYDCETNSLYASSVAGSTRSDMVGRIYKIDMNTGQVASQLDNLDAIGVGVFNTPQGKRLYMGSARTQDVLSVPLTPQGDFAGTPQVEFSLEGLGPDGSDKARKISFDKANQMLVNGTKFNYNLAPPPAQQRPTTYRFGYNPAGDGWSFLDASAGPGSLTN